jgi:hypothetical protein
MVVLVDVLFRYRQRSTRVCEARGVKLDSVARLLRNGLCDDVSVVLFGSRKGWQFLAEKVGVSSQTVSLFECWCLGTYWLVAGAAGQKIILADSWERQDCTSYITVTIVAACLPLRLLSRAQACTAMLRWPRIMHEAGVHVDAGAYQNNRVNFGISQNRYRKRRRECKGTH